MLPNTISHYELGEKLGQGGMGEVYRARDTKLGRDVALKFLPESLAGNQYALERFRREARSASSLSHRNICTIYDIDEAEGRHFISMELLEGSSLKALIGGRPLQPAEIVDIGMQVADALAAAHKKGITHRDIKPGNIFITANGEAKVLDFGLAKLAPLDAAETDLTCAGSTVGTVAYMPPEQARGEEVDGRSDIYSLGIVLYEMSTGQLPYTTSTPALLYDDILHKEPASVLRLNPALPPGLGQVIKKALSKDRSERQQSADELLSELRQLEESPTIPRRWVQVLIAAAVLVAVALALQFFWYLIRSPRSSEPRRLAVLPFEFKGNNPSSQMMCDALVEIITNHLTQLDPVRNSLAVIPASEIRQRKVTSAEEARATFGVSLAITGTAISDASGLRLLLQLVDTTTPNRPRQLESRDLRGTSSLETDSMLQISDMLHVRLQPGDFDLLAAGRSNVPDASTIYLEGRGNLLHYNVPGKIDSAIELFKQSIVRDPAFARAYAGLGEAYLRKYDQTRDTQWLDQAEQSSGQATGLNPNLPDVHVSRGLIATARGRYDAAVAAYVRALQLDPRSYEALQALAGAYERLNKPELAEQTFKKAIELRPDLWTCYNLLGSFYLRHGRYNDAAAQYQQVIAQVPESVWGYNNLGATNLYLGRRSEAMAMFEKADQITPNYAARSNLGRLYFDEGRYGDAARSFERAMELDPRNRALTGNLAAAYYYSGQREKARDAFRKAVEMTQAELKTNPNDARNLSRLAEYHAMLDARSLALAEVGRAVKLAPAETNVLYTAAFVHERFGERDRALEWLEKALGAGYSRELVERSPDMKELRADPRYARMIESLSRKK